MKELFKVLLIMVLSPIAMVILSGLYFGLTFWLTSDAGSSRALGEVVGRISFIVGLPAGAVLGIAVLDRTEKRQKSQALGWIIPVVAWGLAAILFIVPLYPGFGQLLDLLSGRRFGSYIAVGFVIIVGLIVTKIDRRAT